MTEAEARKAIKRIESASSEELEALVRKNDASSRRNRIIGTVIGAAAGAGLGSAPGKVLRPIVSGAVGGGLGYGAGLMIGRNNRKKLYDELKRRRGEKIDKVLAKLDEATSKNVKEELNKTHSGVQTTNTEYGTYQEGKGVYSKDDKMTVKKDKDGKPMLSLLFAGVNSSVLNKKDPANGILENRFYNKNRGKFSDVQANTIFDDPIVADAYIDKFVSNLSKMKDKYGDYPKIRLVGYSAGGRGIVNFLKKMRERDPSFKVNEIIGIDPYQRPWEGVPDELKDIKNPVADRIVYSRLADKYMGSKPGTPLHKKLRAILSNTLTYTFGKRLEGLAAKKIVENHIGGIAHTDPEDMYSSALARLAEM